jgi:hypothetical protein
MEQPQQIDQDKTWVVYATDLRVYRVEVVAKTKKDAIIIASELDGSEFSEMENSGDWEIEDEKTHIKEETK